MVCIVLAHDELVCRLHDESVSAPAFAFVYERFIFGRWEPVCRACFADLEPNVTYEVVYLDPNDNPLKSEHNGADTHDREHRRTG